ncbi:hypothetical protein KIN20_009717 [Parelaphostrongylus tenuis]|uniref:Uncharacterized protein n=1 Tax=Parelaphostrongylus tenuis TaxID=148309 RepID=A0AAD5MSX8_PARTN|nr:hypothetical protein KIN20_009717 [Parelaphostrongylus tenuis]
MDGMCLMAEYAMNEFSLKGGIIDKLVTEIIGRCEPNIALQQGIRIGIYTEEVRDLEDCFNRLYVGDKSRTLIFHCKYRLRKHSIE